MANGPNPRDEPDAPGEQAADPPAETDEDLMEGADPPSPDLLDPDE